MTEQALGAQDIVREGEAAFAEYRDMAEEHGPPPCKVRHPDAGGQCGEPGIMEVYGLAFCEIHGAEAKFGALGEFHDAPLYATEQEEEGLRRAYPLIPERVLEDTADFDYRNARYGSTPVGWHAEPRRLLHKCMRLAHEAGSHWLVEVLEEYREHEAAQLAFALADYEARVGHPSR